MGELIKLGSDRSFPEHGVALAKADCADLPSNRQAATPKFCSQPTVRNLALEAIARLANNLILSLVSYEARLMFMKSNAEAIVTFDQIKGAVGSLIYLWSQVERELADSIRELASDEHTKLPHGIGRSLDRWCQEIRLRTEASGTVDEICRHLVEILGEALDMRNLVCHGLIGITAHLEPRQEEASLTDELNGTTRELTWTELQRMFGWMSQATWVIRHLTNAALETHPIASTLGTILKESGPIKPFCSVKWLCSQMG